MTERGAAAAEDYFDPWDGSERQKADGWSDSWTPEAGSHGKSSESNKGDRSPDKDEIVRIWSEKAGEWRFVLAKYIDDQIAKGYPGADDERAWTTYKKRGWFIHDDGFELDDPC